MPTNEELNAQLRAKHGGEYGKRGSYGPVDAGGFSGVRQLWSSDGGGGGGSWGGSWGGSGGDGGGGAGGSGGSITPFTSNTQTNPQLDALTGDWGDYRKSLAAGNDQDAINAIQRQRDFTTGNMRELSGLMSARGARPGSGSYGVTMGKQLAQGARNAQGLNAALTSDARRQQLGALQGQTGAALGNAGVTLGQQQFGLNAWQANTQAQQAQAQLAAMQQQNSFNNNMRLAQWFTGF